jgi:hypothetical protein
MRAKSLASKARKWATNKGRPWFIMRLPDRQIAAEIGYRAGDHAAMRQVRKMKVRRNRPDLSIGRKGLRIGAIVIYIGDYKPESPYDARLENGMVFLGEIPNMPGHGIFGGSSGKVHFGYHIDDFREATEEEV